jgi:protein-S-isoprenylcysteine O-methyltransferase Ste14
MPGLALVFGAIAHAGYMNGPFIPPGWWTIIFLVLGWFMFCIGAILWIRGILTFGADNIAMLYVYHPAEGKIIESSIYNILRHPVYAGALRVGIGLALLNGNANAIVLPSFPWSQVGFDSWKKEVIERFSPILSRLSQTHPSLLARLGDLGKFFLVSLHRKLIIVKIFIMGAYGYTCKLLVKHLHAQGDTQVWLMARRKKKSCR